MTGLYSRGNDALRTNPDRGLYTGASNINITTHGSNVYWAVTAVMIVSTIAFVGLSFRIHRRNRIFHYITAAITLVAAISYFSMASNLGYAAIPVEFRRRNSKVSGTHRAIFYVRYIDWFLTTPLLLLDLLLTAGLPWPTILTTIFLDEVMIVTGLVGALVASSYKWGYFVFAQVALFCVAWNIIFVARKHANSISPQVGKTFMMCGIWTMFLWFIYPIAWGLSEGGNVIGPDSEAAFYAVLDVLAKPVFGALLLWGHRNIDPAVLGLHIRDYDDRIHPNDKNPGITSAAAAGNGHGAFNGADTTASGVNPHLAANNSPAGVVGPHIDKSTV